MRRAATNSQRARLGALFVVLAAGPLAAQAAEPAPADPPLSTAAIDSAIARGIPPAKGVWFLGTATSTTSSFLGLGNDENAYYYVLAQGPLGRIASAAAAHHQKYLPYTRDSVTPADLAPTFVVVITPQAPVLQAGRWQIAPAVTHVVLIPKAAKGQTAAPAAIQPTTTEPTTQAYTNAGGAVIDMQGMVATFDLAVVPAVAFDVVVITASREYRTTVQAKQLGQLR